jgi:hypothetical protein
VKDGATREAFADGAVNVLSFVSLVMPTVGRSVGTYLNLTVVTVSVELMNITIYFLLFTNLKP